MDILIANLRVPPSGRSEEEIVTFLVGLQAGHFPHLHGKKMILTGDFNLRVDSICSVAIGDHGAAEETFAGGIEYIFCVRDCVCRPPSLVSTMDLPALCSSKWSHCTS